VCGAVEIIDEEGAADADLVAQQRALANLVAYRWIRGCPMAFRVYRGGRIGQLS
jgi:hypothetical protein